MSQNKNKTPDGFEEYKPSGKKKAGPSMKERLLAERRAQAAKEEGASDAPAPQAQAAKSQAPKAQAPKAKSVQSKAAKPTGKPIEKVLGKGADKSAAKAVEKPIAKAAARPVRRVTRAESDAKIDAAEEIAGASTSEIAEDRPKRPARSGAGSARRSSSARSGSSRRRGAEEEEDGEEGGGRRRGGKKEKNMLLPAIGGIAVLAIAGVGVWKLTSGGDTQASTGGETPAPKDAGISDPDAAAAKLKADEDAAQAEKDKIASDKAAADKAAADKAAADKAGPSEPGTPEIKRYAKSGRQIINVNIPDDLYDPSDPSEVKVSELVQFGKPPGVTEEQWTEIQAKATLAMDPDGAAAEGRAAKYLVENYPVAGVPALINGLTALDYSKEENHDLGFFVQNRLMQMCNGRNADWFMDFQNEPNKAQLANGRSVELWHTAWAKNVADPTYWDKFAGNTAAAKRDKGGEDGGEEDEASAADDLLDMMDD